MPSPCRRAADAGALAPVVIRAVLIGALAGWPVAARSADDTHWRTPAQRAIAGGSFSGSPRRAGAAPRDRARLARDGAVLYATHCTSCHGADLAGTRGGPSLLHAGGAAVDFYMTTGRMPLALRASSDEPDHSPLGPTEASGVQVAHAPPLFDARQTRALEAFVDARAREAVPIPEVALDGTLLQRGRRLFEENCQACHGAAAQGATAGEQWTALPLDQATPTQIGEAIRVGPGVMPRFTTAQLSTRDIDALATYVRVLADRPQTYGGATLQYLGPVSEGAVSAIFGVGFLFWVIYFTGTRSDGRRVNELAPPPPPSPPPAR
ncbi:MAG: cytochrome c [Vulcanimicrobiaceae bacterium]